MDPLIASSLSSSCPASSELSSSHSLAYSSGDKLVGDCPTLTVRLRGIDVMCLIDTGSMVSTITEGFFYQHLHPTGSTIHHNIPFLRITAANGLEIPYVGYVEVDTQIAK